ncbi:MAG TPA: transglutaminaseTgpA domain-containing protein [Frankiaceae bacterium]|nr:transglutaminaseTgpA domain-containing protein [Frankiaceae bacterium]
MTALIDRPPEPPAAVPTFDPAPTSGPRPDIGFGIGLLAAVATMLTSTGLSQVFDGFGWWFLPCAGAVLTAFLCGLVGRVARLPLVLLPIVYGLGLVLYVPAICARSTTVGPLPTGSTWSALTDLLGVGAEDVRRLAVPVPERPGLVLLVVLGTYAVACAVDVICTRLRSPATAGLPLLALLAVPAAIVPGDVGVKPFVAGAVGYLLLLAVDGHRAVRERTGSETVVDTAVENATHAPGTLRIALIGLAAAVLLPTVLPGPGKGLISPRDSDSTGLGSDGSGRARVVQPFVTLDQQLRSSEVVPLMRVRTDTPEYLRLTALEVFDGSRFSLGRLQADPEARVRNGLPAGTGVRSRPASGEVRVRDVYRQRYLPVPFTPTDISVSGDWRLHAQTSTVFSGRTDTGGARYSYGASVPAPTAADLRAEPPLTSLPADVGVDLRLPGLDRSVLALARRLTAGAPTTYDKVAAIQAYLRSPAFTYDLNGAPRDGRDALRTFLLETKRGYCEQFASAMAVLVRAVGIPARVAIGFTPGTRDSGGDWVITNRDAHAWPEVWFPNAGWVRFEPTPRDDSAEVTPDYSIPPPPGSVTEGATGSTATDTRDTGPARDAATPTLPGETTPLPSNHAGTTSTSSSRSWGWLAAGVAAVLAGALLTGPALIRLGRRRRRLGTSDPDAAWREVADTATDLGHGALPTESPRAAGRRWEDLVVAVDHDGEVRLALAGLARGAERARFARRGVRPDADRAEVARQARSVVVALERASRRRERIRAWVLPRSLVEAIAAWTGQRRAELRAVGRFGRRLLRGAA